MRNPEGLSFLEVVVLLLIEVSSVLLLLKLFYWRQ
jgi:hypothetical protein